MKTKPGAAVNPRRKDTIMTHEIVPVQYTTNNEHALVFVEKSSIANNPFEQMDWEIDSIMREIEGGELKC